MSPMLQGHAGIVMSAWDNRDGREPNFTQTCGEPASTCDGAVNAISDVKVHTSGFNKEFIIIGSAATTLTTGLCGDACTECRWTWWSNEPN
jgi:hypothetical protein